MLKRTLRLALVVLCTIVPLQVSFGQVDVTVSFGPPALPVYDLPPCPGDGYLWTPGYWAWDPDDGYYWVPGTWVEPPEAGMLWTPGWWGWEDSGFIFHRGYWGPEVGFYGGINYGFGYFGEGFAGGRWDGRVFRYNTAVLNVNTTIIHNTYVDRTVIENNRFNRVSFNGGNGGIVARPTAEQERFDRERHVAPLAVQEQHRSAARANPEMRAARNQGRPPIAATSRAGEFQGGSVVAAREAGAPYHEPPNAAHNNVRLPSGTNAPGEGGAPRGGIPSHARELQPHQITTPNTGDSRLDQRYQQQQQKMVERQNREHEQLQVRQQKEDQAAQQRNWNQQRQQQMEQKHQNQTQHLEQRHTEQTQHLENRQTPSHPSRPH